MCGYLFSPDGRRFPSARVCGCVSRYSRSSASSPSISKAAYLLAELNFWKQIKAQALELVHSLEMSALSGWAVIQDWFLLCFAVLKLRREGLFINKGLEDFWGHQRLSEACTQKTYRGWGFFKFLWLWGWFGVSISPVILSTITNNSK